MKKLFIVLASLMLLIGINSCNSCTQQTTQNDSAAFNQPAVELVVERLVAMDKQDMYLNYANEDNDIYRYFETCITVDNFFDSDEEINVESVSNVFQAITDVDTVTGSADVHVILFAHTKDTSAVEVKHGFWIEDSPMNDEAIKVTFKQALERMYEANLPKPHSKQVVLRKELGPKDCNPQYIFGNSRMQVYVDATTGAVSATNPVFGPQLGMPLGEWP